MPTLPPTPAYILANARRSLLLDKGETRQWIVTNHLEELRLFRDTLEEFIGKEETKEVATLKKQSGANSGEFWADYYPYQWQDIIGGQLRKSFVVSLMGLTEFHVGLICRDVATLTEAKITHEDLKGSVIKRAQKFLETFAHFERPENSKWELMGDLYTLRNSIVHNAALVEADRNSAKLEAFMQRTPGISVPSAGMLEIKEEFGVFVFDSVKSFLEALHDEYVSLCSRVEGNLN